MPARSDFDRHLLLLMPQKDFIALFLLICGTIGGLAFACLCKPGRDWMFALMIFLVPMTEYIDVNFVSRDWYRGTTRGFEVSLVDVLSLSLLGSAILAPRRGYSRGFWP